MMRLPAGPLLALLMTMLMSAAGCAVYEGPENPAFMVTASEASADERRMRADPKPLEVPVVVIGSYRGPDPIVELMTARLAGLTSGRRGDFLRVSTWFEGDIERVAALTVEMVDRKWPVDASRLGENRTIEVDVVGLSMGGLAARFAADRLEGRRLRIRRLITIGTPHRGAVLAPANPLVEDRAVQDMYPGSLFLTRLDEAYRGDYPIVAYARLSDGVVGTKNSAPPWQRPIWTNTPPFGSHLSIDRDPRILADVARRLRGEEPRGTADAPVPDGWDVRLKH